MRHLAALVLLLAVSMPSVSYARRSDVHAYRYDQLWRSVVRLVRVDYGFNVRDRDEEIGFLLFDYVDSGRSYPGSIEVIRVQENGREQVRVSVQIPAMPSYIERMVLDRLTRKLREDYGQPIVAPTRPAEPEPATEPEEEEESGDE